MLLEILIVPRQRLALLQRPASPSQIITRIWGNVFCKPLPFLESKVIAGLGLGLETFRHLLEVWKRTLEDASVTLISVLSVGRGTKIG